MPAPASDRDRVLVLLKRHGWNSTSFQLLEPEFQYWFADDDAAVAYTETRGAWVVGGGPICAEARLAAVSHAFVEHARSRGRRVVFFGVEERLLSAAPLRALEIGQQPWWDPRRWHEVLAARRSLRAQLRRARAKGVSVELLEPERIESAASPLRKEIEALIRAWLASREMPPMAFLVALAPFGHPRERIYVAARAGGTLVGLLVAVPVYDRAGWFFEDLLRDPSAPNGTSELLVDAAMREVASRGSGYVTLGLAPLAGVGGPLELARRMMAGFYSFDGVRAFKAKLGPDGWSPISLAVPADASRWLAIVDALDAFAGGSSVRFGLRAIVRAPSFLLLWTAFAALAWATLLALPFASRWFPSEAARWVWVAFDLAVALGLHRLSRSWSRGLGVTLASLLSLDAVATFAQAAMHNAPRATRPGDWLAIAIGCTAPALVSAILWGGVARHGIK
ncbi:MAG: DUF2156 domain-containing protein [Acidobacteria bacterium]|nr:DUF2156 domain-containing protein [Acidobacteriota bacterium]